jgi:hypothetical protein
VKYKGDVHKWLAEEHSGRHLPVVYTAGERIF